MSRGKCFLCRCEDVTVEEFHAAYREGFTEFESLKRYTGVGTGFCQGKECLSEAALELAQLRGVTPAEIRLTTIRPPGSALRTRVLAVYLESGEEMRQDSLAQVSPPSTVFHQHTSPRLESSILITLGDSTIISPSWLPACPVTATGFCQAPPNHR